MHGARRLHITRRLFRRIRRVGSELRFRVRSGGRLCRFRPPTLQVGRIGRELQTAQSWCRPRAARRAHGIAPAKGSPVGRLGFPSRSFICATDEDGRLVGMNLDYLQVDDSADVVHKGLIGVTPFCQGRGIESLVRTHSSSYRKRRSEASLWTYAPTTPRRGAVPTGLASARLLNIAMPKEAQHGCSITILRDGRSSTG